MDAPDCRNKHQCQHPVIWVIYISDVFLYIGKFMQKSLHAAHIFCKAVFKIWLENWIYSRSHSINGILAKSNTNRKIDLVLNLLKMVTLKNDHHSVFLLGAPWVIFFTFFNMTASLSLWGKLPNVKSLVGPSQFLCGFFCSRGHS